MTFSTKKKLAEAFAGIIPHRMERHRWRGLLRYGPWRTLRLVRRIRKNNSEPEHYLSVCSIAKNEGRYFPEWIEWHLSQGVEKIYIYDNESDDDTAAILAPYVARGVVEYTFWPGRKMQLPAYDDCMERHRFDTRWLVFIDIDEFIVPVRDKNIPEFLRPLEKYPVVEVNWLIYGSGGEKTRREGGVMERFRHHSLPTARGNRHIKSFVDPRRVAGMTGCHEAARIPGRGCAVDSHGEPIKEHFRYRAPLQDVIHINHYAVKSYEEFLEKRARGRARSLDQRGLDYFERFDLNDVL